MRRLILEDPISRSAIWSRNLAFFAFVVALLGILLARQGLDPQTALAIEASALGVAGLSMLSALVAMVVIWRTGYRGIGVAIGGFVLSALLFVYPAYVGLQMRDATGLADVSTNGDDPPLFATNDAAMAARRGIVLPERPSATDRAAQLRLYPDLQTLTVDADPIDVAGSIQKIIKRRRWTIIDTIEPRNFATGHIDAVLKTGLMGFPADVTIRIRGLGKSTQIDIRSRSRAGWEEQPAANATRVQDLLSEIDDQNSES